MKRVLTEIQGVKVAHAKGEYDFGTVMVNAEQNVNV